jgi:mandelamide amidase
VLDAARAADKARAAGGALGALHGIPFAVKDSIHTAGTRNTNGTASMRGFVPRENADAVRLLVDAGAIVLGKTGLTELSFGWTNNNGTFGAVHNPYAHELVPGGSSGGSAAAVAARIAPLALGADTLGSIVVPASFCGVAAFRPTFGRYSNRGAFGLTDDKLDQVGPFARTIEDIALVDRALTGEHGDLPASSLAGVRIGIPPFYREGLEGTVGSVTASAFERLRDAGAVLVEVDVPDELRGAFGIAAAIMLFEAMPSIERYVDAYDVGATADEVVEQMADAKREFFRQVALPPGRPPEDAYRGAVAGRAAVVAALREYVGVNELAAIALPAVGAPPPPIGEEHHVEIDGAEVSFFDAFGRNCALPPVAGAPALMLPGGLSTTGLPVGLELIAVPGADRALLAVGSAVEAVLAFAGDGRQRAA